MNNPLFYIDPTGWDAIAVNFSRQAKGLGHLGLFSVRRNGAARFSDFNPEGTLVRDLVTKISFDSDGIPTKQSPDTLVKELAQRTGQLEDCNLPTSSLP